MPTQEPPSTPPKPAPAAGAVEYLSLPAAARLIAKVGVVECLRGLLDVLAPLQLPPHRRCHHLHDIVLERRGPAGCQSRPEALYVVR